MTGCAPAELLGGGRAYFDALTRRYAERSEVGWDTHELLACLIEVSFASYRALLSLGGADEIPEPLALDRPGQPAKKPQRERISWRDLQRRVSGGGRH